MSTPGDKSTGLRYIKPAKAGCSDKNDAGSRLQVALCTSARWLQPQAMPLKLKLSVHELFMGSFPIWG